MFAHMLDHFIFSSRRISQRTKAIVFAVVGGVIVGTFWWFRNIAFGMEGPIVDHWGLRWRKVSSVVFLLQLTQNLYRAGTSTTIDLASKALHLF
jgi:dolichyl-phosphate-mannose--protein O-mannosyl transferase